MSAITPSLESTLPPGYTRLHITPLDQSLLNVVIPSAVLPNARNISFHTIETFPERRYGYVELPSADADKLKKKLNGLVLKGEKMRIDKARPKPEPVGGAADPDAKKSKKEKKDKKEKKEKSSKKRKREEDVISGVELEGRKIKRGWTMSDQDMIKEKRKEKSKKDGKSKDSTKDKKSKDEKRTRLKSKFTDNPECLFKTKLPSNKSKSKDVDDNTGEDSAHSRKKRRKDDNTVTVHEFEKTTKVPSFLRSTNETTKAEALTFQDGVGWVDGEGNVVEKLTSTRPTGSSRSSKAESSKSKSKKAKPAPEIEDEDTSSSEGSSSEDDGDSSAPEQNAREESKGVAADNDDDDDTSSSGTSSSGTDDSEDEGPSEPKEKVSTPRRTKKLDISTAGLSSPSVAPASAKSDLPSATRPRSSGSMNSLTIKIPQTTTPSRPTDNAVHPLEALYKRAPQDSTTTPIASKPFSFFGNDDDMDIEEDDAAAAGDNENQGGSSSTRKKNLHLQPPMTPYTRQDFEFRNVRSAAPTPDTAHPSRAANFAAFWAASEEDREAGDDLDDDDILMGATATPATAAAAAAIEPETATIPEEDEEEHEEEDEDDAAAAAASSTTATSDFQKQFWENRGDLNRKWRKRKREAAKERRYRDNRARAERAI